MNNRRVFLIILDSVGIGAAPDAAVFGDEGANTMKSISKSDKFFIPNMLKSGLGNIDGLEYLGKTNSPVAACARLKELSMGKDTTIGHLEIAGIVSPMALPTYPKGFPREIIKEFENRTGTKTICNLPYSGTDVIRDYGNEHMETGALIVYTSADSVFQIAAHEDIVPCEKLYEYCKIARELLTGEHGVGRVIARPFTGEYPNFTRTPNRHDFSLEPPCETMLDAIKSCGNDVIAIGKISDIFAGRGITEKIATKNNLDGINATLECLNRDFSGLCFVNLVDFDMVYGHRNNVDGYAAALFEFDSILPKILSGLNENDILMISADHGCDPGDISTDHTREYVPLLIYGNNIKPVNLGTLDGFSHIAATVCDILDVKYDCNSNSLKNLIMK